MATFTVGQRVRIVKTYHDHSFKGREATIIATNQSGFSRYTGEWCEGYYHLNVDGIGPRGDTGLRLCVAGEQLAPLTDPKAEQFLASIRKLKPLHEEPKRVERIPSMLDYMPQSQKARAEYLAELREIAKHYNARDD